MAYFVHIAADVEDYVHGIEGLPAGRRQQVIEDCSRDLADNADHFLPRYPIAHGSYLFAYEYVLADGGLIYSFRFVADGSGMSAGVVQVVYVDYETMPIPS